MNQLLSSEQLSIAVLSKREGVSRWFLYHGRQELKAAGTLRTAPSQLDESCSAETKFGIIVEAAGMSEVQLAEYCRNKGLYPGQLKQ